MFDGLVERYDVVNTVLSLGLDHWWRRLAVRAVTPSVADRVLDLGCGTGDLSVEVARTTAAVGLDLSFPMLLRAKAKGSRGQARPPRFVQGSAARLPFSDGSFDAAVSGFVLRNLRDLPAAFAELGRVIRPGGRLALVDITAPIPPLRRRLFGVYLGIVAPLIGRLIGREDAYRYLAGSPAQLPPIHEVCASLRLAGFPNARARPLTGGVVTLFVATRSS